jgi:pimeloyl-ACP methyl ester carboxylesterase
MGPPAQRQVIAVDEEGHGRTAAADRPLTAENSAGDVLAVLDQLQLDSVDVGFSAGGHTAFALAMRHPARVCRLIAASTFFSRDAVPAEFWEGMKTAVAQETAACGHGCVDACLRLVTRNRHVHVAPVAQRNK